MKSDLASVSQRVDNLTEEVLKLETGLNTLNNSVTHDFSGSEVVSIAQQTRYVTISINFLFTLVEVQEVGDVQSILI